MGRGGSVIRLQDIRKSFGPVQALGGVSLDFLEGECLGLVGHNGAGKSTLIHVLTGGITPTGGLVQMAGAGAGEPHTSRTARRAGIRCVFQELSLCPNLTVAENTRVMHSGLRGWGWRRRAADGITAALDEIFPGHGIAPGTLVADLTLTRRQMVEIARAFTTTDVAPRLVILDEPTSSLDASTAAQLLAHVRRRVAGGCSVLLVSHMLQEVLDTCDRVAVMSDGRVVSCEPTDGLSRERLVAMMGAGIHMPKPAAASTGRSEAARVVHARAAGGGSARSSAPEILLDARQGEVVGLGGLAGHGQTDFLIDLFDARRMALVPGDRQRDGVFPLWSIGENISISSLRKHRRFGLLQPESERRAGNEWKTRMKIRTGTIEAPILSLSGGNQQKALFARTLASDARIILMDDPMRGVDIATKRDVYALIRAEAQAGRTFLWYTTEMDELYECDRVYVFREGRIMAELGPDEITEQRVLQASF